MFSGCPESGRRMPLMAAVHQVPAMLSWLTWIPLFLREMWAQLVPSFSSASLSVVKGAVVQLWDVPDSLFSPPPGFLRLQHLSWLVQERQPPLAILTSHSVIPHALLGSFYSKGRVWPIPPKRAQDFYPLEHSKIDTKLWDVVIKNDTASEMLTGMLWST